MNQSILEARHLRTLSWPSDLATPDDGFMIVRESTHRSSLLSLHRATIGVRLPMLVSSLGRAWLSWCTEDERAVTLERLRQRDDAASRGARDAAAVRRLIDQTRRRGYAINLGEWTEEPSVVGIGCPVMSDGHAIGAVNLVLQRKLVSERDLARRHAPMLQALADEISAGVAALRAA